MLLPAWQLCCYYDVLLLCMNDMHVLYWERLVTCILILRLPCMSGVIPCFVRFQSLLAGILLTKYFTLGDTNMCELLSASLTQYPYHILLPASKLYCWACLLQCLSTKAQSQNWQIHSYLFRLSILTFGSSYSKNKSHSSLACSRCLSNLWPRPGQCWVRNAKQAMAELRKCYCQTSANSHTSTNIKSDAK
jgi:hypothetical protein